jgi:hypothetical protein
MYCFACLCISCIQFRVQSNSSAFSVSSGTQKFWELIRGVSGISLSWNFQPEKGSAERFQGGSPKCVIFHWDLGYLSKCVNIVPTRAIESPKKVLEHGQISNGDYHYIFKRM